MSRDRWIFLCFGVLGLAVAVGYFSFFRDQSPTESPAATIMFAASPVLCPGFFFLEWLAALQQHTPNFALILAIIALINFVYDAAVGAGFMRWRKKPEKTD
jgi:drug/metabolite transporter (DMT)-like permease